MYEGGLFFITLTVVGWVDVFIRHQYNSDEIIENFCFLLSTVAHTLTFT